MKNQHIWPLITITIVFFAFLLGFFFGRQISPDPIQISAVLSDGPVNVTAEPANPEKTVTFPININTAEKLELTALPGIGEVLAGRIIEYREQNGGFSTVDELMNVSGISNNRFNAIKDYVSLGGES